MFMYHPQERLQREHLQQERLQGERLWQEHLRGEQRHLLQQRVQQLALKCNYEPISDIHYDTERAGNQFQADLITIHSTEASSRTEKR